MRMFRTVLIISALCCRLAAQQSMDYSPVLGRWDLTIIRGGEEDPAWLELAGDNGGLTGRYVGGNSHARPLLYTHFDGRELVFSFAPRLERRQDDILFKGVVEQDRVEGETTNDRGEFIPFRAVRAPELPFRADVRWGEPVRLLAAEDLSLSKWRVERDDAPNGWSFENGVLTNTPPGVNLLTVEDYMDFKLHVEFRLPGEGPRNSGVYLRGRYEIQIVPPRNYEMHRGAGSIYGYIAPSVIPPPADDGWSVFDITLIGRWVTLIYNGETVLEKQEIPGITVGARDSHEGEPGPVLLQGNHGGVQYRNIIIAPALD